MSCPIQILLYTAGQAGCGSEREGAIVAADANARNHNRLTNRERKCLAREGQRYCRSDFSCGANRGRGCLNGIGLKDVVAASTSNVAGVDRVKYRRVATHVNVEIVF